MTLTIHTEEDEQRQLTMTVEVPEQRVEKAMREAARKLAREIHFPGFRRGKAPYRVILRRVGRDALRGDVIEDMLQPVLEEAIEQVEAEVYAPPVLEELEPEPLVFKFTVPLSPVVELGNYRDIRKEIEPVEITDEALELALEQIRVRHQIVETVERPAQLGDIVTVSGKGELSKPISDEESDETEPSEAADDTPDEVAASDDILFEEESIDFLMDPEKLFAGTPFVDEIVGLSAGESKSFEFEFSDDYGDEELAGRKASVNIAILEVKSRELPELDDELAKTEGDYESLDELKSSVLKSLEDQARAAAKNELIEAMVDDLMNEVKLVYPPAAIELEMDEMMESFKRQVTRSGWEWDDYLKIQADSEESLREGFRERAQEVLERRLALRQFILDERLTVEESDVDILVNERVSAFNDNQELQESMAKYYRSGYGLNMISSEILMDKTHQRVEAILIGQAPDLEALDDHASDEEE